MKLMPKTITELSRIVSGINLGWFEFCVKIHENLEKISDDVCNSPEQRTVFFKNKTESYKLITVGENLMLSAVVKEGCYEVLFIRVGTGVRFSFEGSIECFMCDSMQKLFNGIEWDRLVTRSKLEKIKY